MKVGYQDSLPNCCGVDDVGGWLHTDPEAYDYRDWCDELRKSGTGLFTATFIDHPSSRKAYDRLTQEHTLLYQSPVKRNANSRNQLFLCVFQWKPARRRRNERPGETLPQL